jgi:hypothetical protein
MRLPRGPVTRTAGPALLLGPQQRARQDRQLHTWPAGLCASDSKNDIIVPNVPIVSYRSVSAQRSCTAHTGIACRAACTAGRPGITHNPKLTSSKQPLLLHLRRPALGPQ